MSVNKLINEDEQILIFKYNQVLNRVICPKCSSELLYFDEYCYNCGNKLNKSPVLYIPNINSLKTIKKSSTYELGLKYASVTLLRQLMFNPLYSEKENFLLQAFKNVSFYDIRKYLVEEGHIEILTGMKKIKAGLKAASEEYIDNVISQKALPKGISKAGKITILTSNLSEAELDAMIPNYYLVTQKGIHFYEENKHCRLYSIVFYDFDLEYYDKEYANSKSELKDFAIKLLDESLNEITNTLKWQSYSDLLFKYAEIYDIYEEYDKMLKFIIEHFICEINPFTDNKIKNKIEISLNLRNKIVYSISRANTDYKELLKIVNSAIEDINLPKNFIKNEDIILLIEELFDKYTTLKDINSHLTGLYNLNNVEIEKLVYTSVIEQEKVINELKKAISF